MSTRSKEEIQEIWEATLAPHTKSNKPPRLTKREKKLIGAYNDEGRATLKYARISSRKIKIVADLIRGKNAQEAMNTWLGGEDNRWSRVWWDVANNNF